MVGDPDSGCLLLWCSTGNDRHDLASEVCHTGVMDGYGSSFFSSAFLNWWTVTLCTSDGFLASSNGTQFPPSRRFPP